MATKSKQLRARVDDDTYMRVENRANKVSDYVREAVIEKLEREDYGNDSTILVEVKQLELLLESRQSIITQYTDLINKEKEECKRIQAKIDEKNRLLEQKSIREKKIKNDPLYQEEFDNATMFLLRKKYLGLDANVERVLSSKARTLNYNRVNDFKEDLKDYVKEKYLIGKIFVIENEKREIIQQDIDYMMNRLA